MPINVTEDRNVLGFNIPKSHLLLMDKSGLCDKFDPYDFVEIGKNFEEGNERVYLRLSVKAQALWFRSVYPDGRVVPEYKGQENGISHVVEVNLYKNDREGTLPFAKGIAVTNPGESKPEGETLISYANIIASSMAYTNAGFNIPPISMSLPDYAALENNNDLSPTPPCAAGATASTSDSGKRTRKKKEPEIKPKEIPAPPLDALTVNHVVETSNPADEEPAKEPVVEVVGADDVPTATVEVKRPVVITTVETLDDKLNAAEEVDYDSYDREFSESEVSKLARIVIKEGGQNVPAGRIVLAGGPLVRWLIGYANDDTAPKCRRAQAKIVKFLDDFCANDPILRDYVADACGVK